MTTDTTTLKRWRFTYELTGVGQTEEEALDSALESFVTDPGEPSSAELDWDQDGLD